MKQLICGGLNGLRIRQSLPQPYIPQTGMQVPLKDVAAGSWSLGIVEQSQGEGCCYCQEMDRGDVREETEVGNACGGKPGSHGSKATLRSHT